MNASQSTAAITSSFPPFSLPSPPPFRPLALSFARLSRSLEQAKALWIAAGTGRDEILCLENDLKWLKNKVKALGVWFSTQ